VTVDIRINAHTMPLAPRVLKRSPAYLTGDRSIQLSYRVRCGSAGRQKCSRNGMRDMWRTFAIPVTFFDLFRREISSGSKRAKSL
jgi:hypothetical protein